MSYARSAAVKRSVWIKGSAACSQLRTARAHARQVPHKQRSRPQASNTGKRVPNSGIGYGSWDGVQAPLTLINAFESLGEFQPHQNLANGVS
jgi:hypothetical protein